MIGPIMQIAHWYSQALERYKTAPAALSKPCRDLTDAEATEVVAHLVATNHITLEKALEFNKSGVLTYPAKGVNVRVGTLMDGVRYRHLKAGNVPNIGNVNQKFVVVMYKFAKEMAEQFGATEIVWGGIGIGGDQKSKKDSHHTGRAIDFWGMVTQIGTVDVHRDWGTKPVDLAYFGLKPQKSHEKGDEWKGNRPRFRLIPGRDDPAHRIFQAVYDFATRECQDYSTGPSVAGKSASKIGAPAFIFHPDYPLMESRPGHRNHMHFHIGTV